MSDVVEQIKDRLDLVEFIKNYVQLTPAGKNFKGLCPFHKEKTPSFMVSPDRGMWRCFGSCNEGGDIFKFVMKFENLEFYEVLKILAEKAGVNLQQSPRAGEFRNYNILYEINESAKKYFQKNLTKESIDYLYNRGLKKETILEFCLGLAPANNPDQLLRFLSSRGFAVADMERAGLIFRTERGTYWDRFQGRIMFPIFNSFGKVVGFTGRLLGSSNSPVQAKYVNSPETPIFNKSKILYGLSQAKNFIREAGVVLLVEGQMDFLMTYQSGVKNVVATSGTALTHDHLKVLRRLADRLILSFDNDEAGQKAIERGIDLAVAHDFAVRVLDLGLDGKDPAEIVAANPDQLKNLIIESKLAREFYLNRYLPTGSILSSSYQQRQAVRALLAKVRNIYSPIEQSYWLKDIANRSGIDERSLGAELEKIKLVVPKAANVVIKENKGQIFSRKQLIAQRVVSLAGDSKLVAEIDPKLAEEQVSGDLVLLAEWENSRLDPALREEELKELTKQLRIEVCKDQLLVLRQVIAEAEKLKNSAKIEECLKEFDKISRKLHNINQ